VGNLWATCRKHLHDGTPNAPTPRAFADAWVGAARSTLTKEAGRDQRLTRAAAVRVGEAADFGQFAMDNLRSFFDRTGQKSVSVTVFLAAEHARIEAAASAVAGNGNRVSLAEGERLPSDLRQDFKALRGRIPASFVALTGQALIDASVTQARAAFANGTATLLAVPPPAVRGRQPIIEDVVHTVVGHKFDLYIAANRLWGSMAADRAGTGLVGFYNLGPKPTP
jgi:hypothetical protein